MTTRHANQTQETAQSERVPVQLELDLQPKHTQPWRLNPVRVMQPRLQVAAGSSPIGDLALGNKSSTCSDPHGDTRVAF